MGCDNCATLEARVAELEAELAEARGTPAPGSSAVRELFEYWQLRTGHERAKLDAKRARKIRDRLKDGYTVDEIRQAINGVAKFPFVVDGGRSSTGRSNQRFDDIELVCRNGPNLERFGQLGVGTIDRNVERAKLVGT